LQQRIVRKLDFRLRGNDDIRDNEIPYRYFPPCQVANTMDFMVPVWNVGA
jgi:hypothetical protein